MEKRLKENSVAIVALISGILAAAALILFFIFIFWFDGIKANLSRFAVSEGHIPLTLTVFGRSAGAPDAMAGTISARLDFYTADGDRTANIERSWTGWELIVDCIMVRLNSGYLVFPFLAYTDVTKRGHGVDLFRYYDRKLFPSLYEFSSLTNKERSSLKILFAFVKSETWVPVIFGSLRHETVSIRSFEAGKEYWLYVANDGKISLRSN